MRFHALYQRQTKNADGRNLAGQRRPQACKNLSFCRESKIALVTRRPLVNQMQQSLAAGLTASSFRTAICNPFSYLTGRIQ
jgi:hypothetical protein